MEVSSANIAIPICIGCGIGNVIKGFISFLSINENTKMLYNNNYIFGDYQNIFHSKHIINDEDPSYVKCFSWRFLILKEEEELQKHLINELTDFALVEGINKQFNLFSTKVAIDSYYNRALICDKVYDRIMRGINRIQWHETIITELQKLTDKLKMPALGISVRTWEACHEKGVTNYRKYDFNKYKNAINKIINENSIKSIYISYDNHKVENDYKNILNNYDIITYEKNDNITLLQYTIIKMLLLSKCNFFVCSRISTFSELVFWFNGCNQEVIDV